MNGYSKILQNNAFIQRTKSNKEFLFNDRDFDLKSSKSTNKKPHLVHQQESSILDQTNTNKKVGFVIEKPKVITSFEHENREEFENGDHPSLKKGNGEKNGVLRRNFSISLTNSPYQEKNNNVCLERQSSTKAIKEAVKKAFSKRSSSVNNYDRYCRIYDQPNMNSDDCEYHDDVNGNYDHQDDDFERNNGSLDTRYVSMMKKNTNHLNHGRRHVGSKVMKACKRLFSL